MEQEKILERWQEYISTLYDDARGEIPQISKDTKLSPLRKAPGPDDITTEMLVAVEEGDGNNKLSKYDVQ